MQNSENFSKNLIVNNYEVSSWESFFLKIWSEHQEGICISYDTLLDSLGLDDLPLLRYYFVENDGYISLNVFIEFICTFTFFSIKQLMPVLLSINKIQSNKFLTEEQALNFFKSLKLTKTSMQLVEMWVSTVERLPKNYISLQSLYTLIKTNEGLLFPLYNIKTHIIDIVITRKQYNTINNRIEFYKNRKGNYTIPKESLCEKISRRIHSYDPPPYYHNYFPNIQNLNADNYLIQIRRKHGYSVLSSRRKSAHSEVNRKSLYSNSRNGSTRMKIIGSPVIANYSINLNYRQKAKSTGESISFRHHSKSSKYVLHNGRIVPIDKHKSVV